MYAQLQPSVEGVTVKLKKQTHSSNSVLCHEMLSSSLAVGKSGQGIQAAEYGQMCDTAAIRVGKNISCLARQGHSLHRQLLASKFVQARHVCFADSTAWEAR